MNLESSLDVFQTLDPAEYLAKFTNEKTRPTGRPFHAARATTIVPSVLCSRHDRRPSSLVKMGETQVMSSASLSIGTPAAAGGEVSCSLHSGGHHAMASETSLLNRILATNSLHLSDLVILPRRAAWNVHVSIVVLHDDGNIIDASILSAISTLSRIRLPTVRIDDRDYIAILPDNNNDKYLELRHLPVPLTIGIFQDSILLVDPTIQEERVCRGFITVVVSADSNVLYSLEKRGKAIVSMEQMAACVPLALGRAQELHTILT